MPSMTDHEANHLVKILIAGDSGGGKSGALASLVDAGLNVRVFDFDNGLSVLRGFVKNKALLANVHYRTFKDDLKLMSARIGISKAHAFQEAMDLMDKGGELWGKGITPEQIGPITSWTPRDVLVLDTLTSAGRASLQMVMQANAAGFKSPEIQHYGTAMENIEKLIGIITSPAVGCHVIVNTHIMNIEGTSKLYPDALGSKLGPKLGRYFDNMITLSVNSSAERSFKTVKDGLFACKTASKIADTYPISTGLHDIFLALTGKKNIMEGL